MEAVGLYESAILRSEFLRQTLGEVCVHLWPTIWRGIMSIRKVGSINIQNQDLVQGLSDGDAEYIAQVLRYRALPVHEQIFNFRLQQDISRIPTAQHTLDFDHR